MSAFPAPSLTETLTKFAVGGGLESSWMLALAGGDDVLPAASMNCASTVFTPLPGKSVQVLVGRNCSHGLQFEPLSLLKRIWVTRPLLSVASRLSVTT